MKILKDYQLNQELIINQNDKLTIYTQVNQSIDKLDILLKANSYLKILFINSSLNLNIVLEENAEIEIYNVYLLKESTTIDILANLNGENAIANIINVFLSANDSSIKSNVLINHNKPKTNSDFNVYAIAEDNSEMILNNNAHIINGMHQSNAIQKTKGLNLSPNSKIVARPNLFIDEYDVKASHSVSIGSINQDDLFYLMSRGLTKEESEKLIVLGFISPIISNIEDDILKEYIYKQFTQNL